MPHPDRRYCFLYRNATITEQPIDLTSLTTRMVTDSKEFIEANENNPFLLIVSFAQVHTSMFNDPEFAGKSRRGKRATSQWSKTSSWHRFPDHALT